MRATLPALLMILALMPPAGAEHCTTYSTSLPEVTTPTAAGKTYYVDLFLCQICDWWFLFPYEESNGIEGLQRADDIEDDTCHGMIAPDTLL